MKKRLSLLLAGLMTASVLTGCGSEETNTDTSEGSATETDSSINTSTADDDYDVEFFVSKFETRETWDAMEKDFLEKTGYRVKINSPQDATELLKDRVRNNNAPDIFQNQLAGTLNTFVEEGKIQDVTDWEFLNNLDTSSLDRYYVPGIEGTYSVPLSFSAVGWYYNADAFEEFGYTQPTNWDEVVALSEQVDADREAGKHNMSVFSTAGGDPYLIYGMHQMLWAQELQGYDAAQDYFLESEKGAVGKQAIDGVTTIEENGYDSAFNLVADRLGYVAQHSQPNYGTAKAEDAIISFVSEESLIFTGGTFTLPLIRQAAPQFAVEMMPFVGESEMIIGDADMAICVSADAKNPDATKAFLEYLTTAENYQMFYDVDGNATTVQGVVTGENFPELAGLNPYFNTEKHIPWMHSEWSSNSDFKQLTIDYMITMDQDALYEDLNRFFDSEKDLNAQK